MPKNRKSRNRGGYGYNSGRGTYNNHWSYYGDGNQGYNQGEDEGYKIYVPKDSTASSNNPACSESSRISLTEECDENNTRRPYVESSPSSSGGVPICLTEETSSSEMHLPTIPEECAVINARVAISEEGVINSAVTTSLPSEGDSPQNVVTSVINSPQNSDLKEKSSKDGVKSTVPKTLLPTPNLNGLLTTPNLSTSIPPQNSTNNTAESILNFEMEIIDTVPNYHRAIEEILSILAKRGVNVQNSMSIPLTPEVGAAAISSDNSNLNYDVSLEGTEDEREISSNNESDKQLEFKQVETNKKSNRVRVITENILAVDCEGHRLSREGPLSLIQIAVNGAKCYVFDLLLMRKDNKFSVDPLKSILENEDICKLFFDVRRDSEALWAQLGISLRGVRDLQILEFIGRNEKDWHEGDELNRIMTTLHNLSVEDRKARPSLYHNVKRLHGLVGCLNFFKIPGREVKQNVGRAVHDDSGNMWMYRPLAKRSLDYAAVDVVSLFPLLCHLAKRRVRMPSFNLESSPGKNIVYDVQLDQELGDASARYVDFHKSSPVMQSGTFFDHGYMAIGIIEDAANKTSFINNIAKCDGCQRDFPTSNLIEWSDNRWNAIAHEYYNSDSIICTNKWCAVCRAIAVARVAARFKGQSVKQANGVPSPPPTQEGDGSIHLSLELATSHQGYSASDHVYSGGGSYTVNTASSNNNALLPSPQVRNNAKPKYNDSPNTSSASIPPVQSMGSILNPGLQHGFQNTNIASVTPPQAYYNQQQQVYYNQQQQQQPYYQYANYPYYQQQFVAIVPPHHQHLQQAILHARQKEVSVPEFPPGIQPAPPPQQKEEMTWKTVVTGSGTQIKYKKEPAPIDTTKISPEAVLFDIVEHFKTIDRSVWCSLNWPERWAAVSFRLMSYARKNKLKFPDWDGEACRVKYIKCMDKYNS